MTIACTLIPRFELVAVLGGRRGLLREPVALAPEAGEGAGAIGEVSGRAEAHGVRPGMRVGEALGRCPELVLVPTDPERIEGAWEEVVGRLEEIGAAVFSERVGEAYFEAGGLRGLWGGDLEGVIVRARKATGSGGRSPSSRGYVSSARIAVGPSRFCAYAAAATSSGRRGREKALIVDEDRARSFLAPLPVRLLASRIGGELPELLEQLGIRTLGRLAALGHDAVADRFGKDGLEALRLARGFDRPLLPSPPREPLAVELELPDALSGPQLQRALEMLIDRLLAEPARRARAVRRLTLSARLAAGGGWRREKTLRRASADPAVLRLALSGLLDELPEPAEVLRLAAELGPRAQEQLSLSDPDEERRQRLEEAVRQTRAAAGREAVLRVLDIDPDSRLPERRAALTPFQ